MAGLLYADSVQVTDKIRVRIPTMDDVLKDSDNYFDCVSAITATPYDMMVQLDDAGIDFTKINAFELFCLTYKSIAKRDMSLIFDNIDLSKFNTAVNEEDGSLLLIDNENQIVIDRLVHHSICKTISEILYIEKENKKPANDEARKYLIERARKKQSRRKNKNSESSQIENIIIALVNTSEFSYTYNSVREMSVYQFYSSLHQVSHKIKYDNTMFGYFSGNIKLDDVKQSDRTWFRTV